MEEKEIWKPVKGFEDYYDVSSLGRIRSKDRVIIQSNGVFHHRKQKILKAHANKSNNLLQVMLVVHKRFKLVYVHRLVGEVFVENPHGFPNLTHVNNDNQDNRAINLKWISRSPKLNKKLNL